MGKVNSMAEDKSNRIAVDSIKFKELSPKVLKSRRHSLISYGVSLFVTLVIFVVNGNESLRFLFDTRFIPGRDIPTMALWLIVMFGGLIYGSWKGVCAYRHGARDRIFKVVLVLGLLVTLFWLLFMVAEVVNGG